MKKDSSFTEKYPIYKLIGVLLVVFGYTTISLLGLFSTAAMLRMMLEAWEYGWSLGGFL